MHDLRHLTKDLDATRAHLHARGYDEPLAGLAALVARRREVITSEETLRAKRNEVSKAMAAIADKKSAEFGAQREAMRAVGDEVKALEEEHRQVEQALHELLAGMPNFAHPSTPPGRDERDNVLVRTYGEPPPQSFAPKDHVDLGLDLGIFDFARASKISGARFCVLRGFGARLERALVAFMLDVHREMHGYEEMWLPVLVRGQALFGTGQLPKFAQDLFPITRQEGWAAHQADETHDFYLSPTAEVQLTNLHADEILEVATLPCTYAAYAPCFRAEAGSYGRDTRGLIRQHQFDKVELVRIVHPDDGERELDVMTGHAEAVLQRLELHHRVVQLCAGDMGFCAQKSFDLEVWLPSQGAFREISSCSWCGDFQARRANIRFRPDAKGKPQWVHTLNGSGVAVGRAMVALLEQHQQADGSVRVPEALQPYLGGTTQLGPPCSPA